jgi:hypothetical protein
MASTLKLWTPLTPVTSVLPDPDDAMSFGKSPANAPWAVGWIAMFEPP